MQASTRILVIDDENQLRELLVDVLHSEGFFVASAADGREGLAKVETLHPDAIILD